MPKPIDKPRMRWAAVAVLGACLGVVAGGGSAIGGALTTTTAPACATTPAATTTTAPPATTTTPATTTEPATTATTMPADTTTTGGTTTAAAPAVGAEVATTTTAPSPACTTDAGPPPQPDLAALLASGQATMTFPDPPSPLSAPGSPPPPAAPADEPPPPAIAIYSAGDLRPLVPSSPTPAATWPVPGDMPFDIADLAYAIADARWPASACRGAEQVSFASEDQMLRAAGRAAPTTDDESLFIALAVADGCHVLLNSQATWSPVWLCMIAEHEFGHLAGRQHVADPNDVMAPTVRHAADCEAIFGPADDYADAAGQVAETNVPPAATTKRTPRPKASAARHRPVKRRSSRSSASRRSRRARRAAAARGTRHSAR